MNIKWLSKQLGLRFAQANESTHSQNSTDNPKSLVQLGYPGVFYLDFYLSQERALIYHKTKQLTFPKKCSVCGNECTKVKSINYKVGIFKKYSILEVPFCQQHVSQKIDSIIIKTFEISPVVIKVFAASQSTMFLNEFKENNLSTIPPMPWIAFPTITSESSGWRQGDSEQWWLHQWIPYWKSLNEKARDEILMSLKLEQSLEWYDRLKKM